MLFIELGFDADFNFTEISHKICNNALIYIKLYLVEVKVKKKHY
jgi:hypothetical protein